MRFLEEMAERMDDELDGAEEYAEKALHYKESHPALAKHLHDMSMDELRHASYFCDAAMDYVKAHPEHPEFKDVWAFVKRHADKEIDEVNGMLAKYRG
jgi:ferritin